MAKQSKSTIKLQALRPVKIARNNPYFRYVFEKDEIKEIPLEHSEFLLNTGMVKEV